MTPAGVWEAVGLMQLLASPRSNYPVTRWAKAACIAAVGLAYPMYASCKALEAQTAVQRARQQAQWLTYWTILGGVTMAEGLLTAVVDRAPFYSNLKLGLLLWLQHPATQGARRVYSDFVRPVFLRYQAHIDQYLQHLHDSVHRLGIDATATRVREAVKELPVLSYLARSPDEG